MICRINGGEDMPQTVIYSEKRADQMEHFLTKNDVVLDLAGELPKDASSRTYYRLNHHDEKVILMDAPAEADRVEPFIIVANHLNALGLNAPDIYAQDVEDNFLLLEDYGNNTFSKMMNDGHDPEDLYELAVDALAHMHMHPQATDIHLPAFGRDELQIEAGLLPNWYYAAKTGKEPTDVFKKEWVEAWDKVIEALPEIEQTMVLRDFHCDNLMFVPGYSGIRRCGMLDFQSAVIGALPYDLVSLLENDRRAVPEAMQERLLERYFSKTEIKDKDAFMTWYRFMSGQRQSKVLGIFYRLYIRDHKSGYMKFIPQVIKLLEHSFKDPMFAPVVDVISKHIGTLTFVEDFDLEAVRALKLNNELPL